MQVLPELYLGQKLKDLGGVILRKKIFFIEIRGCLLYPNKKNRSGAHGLGALGRGGHVMSEEEEKVKFRWHECEGEEQ